MSYNEQNFLDLGARPLSLMLWTEDVDQNLYSANSPRTLEMQGNWYTFKESDLVKNVFVSLVNRILL